MGGLRILTSDSLHYRGKLFIRPMAEFTVWIGHWTLDFGLWTLDLQLAASHRDNGNDQVDPHPNGDTGPIPVDCHTVFKLDQGGYS